MSSTTITITKFNGTNYAQWATEMALLLEQKQVYCIIKGYDDKPEEPAANATATEKATFKDWMNRHGVARSTILLGMEPRRQAEYTVVDDAKTLREKLASASKSKLKLNIFEIREDHWSIMLQDCGDVDNYASQTNRKVKDYNLSAGPIAPSTAGTEAADTDANAKTIANMSEQEHIFYLLRGIPRNDEWKVFLELRMDKNATMTATLNEIVTKLVEKEAAIKREKWLALEALLFAKKGGGNGGKAGKVGKSPKRDKRDDKRDIKDYRKEKDFRKCFHCQRQVTSEAKEEVTRIRWPWDVTWRSMEATGRRQAPEPLCEGYVGRVCTIGSWRWRNRGYDSHLRCSCDLQRSQGCDRS